MTVSKLITRKFQVAKRLKYCEMNRESKQTAVTKSLFPNSLSPLAERDKQGSCRGTAGVKDVSKHGGHIHSFVEEPVLSETHVSALERG